MKGLRIVFSCPDCGNTVRDEYPARTLPMLKRNLVKPDLKCSCGNSTKFIVDSFETIEYQIKK